MEIFIAITSILVITALAWALNKSLPFKVCPICAGVAGTWAWMLAGMLSGYLSTTPYQLLTAVLMGGSVVGIANLLEKRLPQTSGGWRTPLLWKTLFIPAGFTAVYGILLSDWYILATSAIFLVLITLLFAAKLPLGIKNKKAPRHDEKVEKIEKEMEKCC